MARRKTDDLQKHTLNLRQGDVETIQSMFPNQQATVIIRRIVSKFVDVQRAAQAHIDAETAKALSKEIDL